MQVSLIVTTYNWKAALALVLASALDQSRLPDEIIVADDGSSDGTGQLIAELAATAPIPLIHAWQEDLGFRAARARNLAIAASRGDYLLMIDGDMLLEPHFVADHLSLARPGFFSQGSRVILDEELSGRLLGGESPAINFFTPGLGNRKNTLRAPWLARLLSEASADLYGIRTCNFALWRKDALAVNGFDEDFTGWGREDSEFAARLINSGIRRQNLRFAALARHLHHPIQERAGLGVNDLILARTIEEKRRWCVNGIQKG